MAGGIVVSQQASSLPPGIVVPNSFFNIIVSFAAALGGFLFGYEIGIVDAVLRMDGFDETFGITSFSEFENRYVDTPNAADIKGWVTSTFLFGCVIGAAVSLSRTINQIVTWMADKIGRKRSILVGGAFFTLGGGLQAASSTITVLYASRIVSGVGIGILSMCVPLYISETAPTHVRGRMIAIQQLMITIGIFVASCINSVILTYCTGEFQWRFALSVQCIPGALLLIIMFFMPYSPRWLMNYDRDDEAIQVLSKLRASEPSSIVVQCEYTDIKNGIAFERRIGSANWSELLKKGISNRVMIAVMLQTFQQWTGINVILYYAGELFAKMGLGDAGKSVFFVIINSFVNVIATFPGMYLIERMGRKKLLVIGGFAMGIAHFCVAIFIGFSVNVSVLAWFAVVSVYVFIIFFSSTWGPVVWVYQSEIFPLRIRAKGTGLATIVNWGWNAVIAKITPLIQKHIGFYMYTIFGSAGILMAFYALFYLPETMGKRLEDMDELFGAVNVEQKRTEEIEKKA